MDNTFTNRRVVITGGSEGIGFAIAEAFAAKGAALILIARNEQKLSLAAKQLNSTSVSTIAADLSNARGLQDAITAIQSRWDSIDVLVNNAGTAQFTAFSETPIDQLDHCINLNIKAPYRLTQGLLPALKNAKGSIINISSYFAHRMLHNRPSSAYSLTKAAINAFTQSLAFELGNTGVRVNAVAPGTVETPLFIRNKNALSEAEKTQFEDDLRRNYPLGHIGQPEDIAKAVLFLASSQASWVTGEIMAVDGGLTTH